jgi:hypothetical protein
MPIVGYYHICAINNYHSIVQDQITALKRSGLFDATDHINVVLLSPRHENIPELTDPKFRLRHVSSNLNLFERAILNLMRQDCQNAQQKKQVNYVWYIHSKGVSNKHQTDHLKTHIRTWRKSMEAVVVWNWESCVKKLSQENYDTCGVYYTNRIVNKYHYAGNFWWARASYIAKLPPLNVVAPSNFNLYVEPEMWLCLRSPRACSFFPLTPGYILPNLAAHGLKPVPT